MQSTTVLEQKIRRSFKVEQFPTSANNFFEVFFMKSFGFCFLDFFEMIAGQINKKSSSRIFLHLDDSQNPQIDKEKVAKLSFEKMRKRFQGNPLFEHHLKPTRKCFGENERIKKINKVEIEMSTLCQVYHKSTSFENEKEGYLISELNRLKPEDQDQAEHKFDNKEDENINSPNDDNSNQPFDEFKKSNQINLNLQNNSNFEAFSGKNRSHQFGQKTQNLEFPQNIKKTSLKNEIKHDLEKNNEFQNEVEFGVEFGHSLKPEDITIWDQFNTTERHEKNHQKQIFRFEYNEATKVKHDISDFNNREHQEHKFVSKINSIKTGVEDSTLVFPQTEGYSIGAEFAQKCISKEIEQNKQAAVAKNGTLESNQCEVLKSSVLELKHKIFEQLIEKEISSIMFDCFQNTEMASEQNRSLTRDEILPTTIAEKLIEIDLSTNPEYLFFLKIFGKK